MSKIVEWLVISLVFIFLGGPAFAADDMMITGIATTVPSAPLRPGPNLLLYNAPFYTCLRNFYVSTTGNDANNGTAPDNAHAWATIGNADSSTQAGDCVNVAAGTYTPANAIQIQHGGNAPTSTGYVVYRCSALDQCIVNGSAGLGFNSLVAFGTVTITGTTNGSTASNNNVLHFAAGTITSMVAAGLVVGSIPGDVTACGGCIGPPSNPFKTAIENGNFVTAIGATTVTLNANVTGGTVNSGDTIYFGGANAAGGNFVVFDGFVFDGVGTGAGQSQICLANEDDNNIFNQGAFGVSTHHVWAINNIIRNCGQSGIQWGNKEWYYIVHNRVYGNSNTSGFAGSGVSIFQAECIENATNCYPSGPYYTPSGMDNTYAPPFQVVVEYNDFFNNRQSPGDTGANCGKASDGNGLIFDSWFPEALTPADCGSAGPACFAIAYPMQSIILGNASYLNGGRGINLFGVNKATVANNTMYGNGQDVCVGGTVLPDLSINSVSNSVIVNNLAVAVLTTQDTTDGDCATGTQCGANNQSICDGNGWWDPAGNTFFNNVTDGAAAAVGCGLNVCLNGNNATPGVYGSSNLQLTDPKYTNPNYNTNAAPGNSNLTIKSGSPARAYVDRVTGMLPWIVDGGACKFTFSQCP